MEKLSSLQKSSSRKPSNAWRDLAWSLSVIVARPYDQTNLDPNCSIFYCLSTFADLKTYLYKHDFDILFWENCRKNWKIFRWANPLLVTDTPATSATKVIIINQVLNGTNEGILVKSLTNAQNVTRTSARGMFGTITKKNVSRLKYSAATLLTQKINSVTIPPR